MRESMSMQRPAVKLPKEWEAYVEWLEKLQDDPRADLLRSMIKKFQELSEQMDLATIDFTDKDDKAFDRVIKVMEKSRELSENFKFLRNDIGIERTKDEGSRGYRNPMEQTAK